MHHGGDLMLPDDRPHGGGVLDVPLDQGCAKRRRAMPAAKTIEKDNAVTGAAQRLGRMTADIAGPTGHQNRAQVIAPSKSR